MSEYREMMEVFVDGVVQRRAVDSYARIDGSPLPPMPQPVLSDDEIVLTTVSGDTHVLRR